MRMRGHLSDCERVIFRAGRAPERVRRRRGHSVRGRAPHVVFPEGDAAPEVGKVERGRSIPGSGISIQATACVTTVFRDLTNGVPLRIDEVPIALVTDPVTQACSLGRRGRGAVGF